MNVELDHLVLSVRDMDAMLRFYLDVVGLAPHRVDEYRAGTVPFPCARLTEGTILDLLPPAMWGGDGAGVTTWPNMNHFCIAVAPGDWDGLLARLDAASVEIEAGPMTLSGARGDATSIYVRDPDGNRVEFRHYGERPG